MAGIPVKMITGDHLVTARAIARQIGLGERRGTCRRVSGRELERLSGDADLADVRGAHGGLRARCARTETAARAGAPVRAATSWR